MRPVPVSPIVRFGDTLAADVASARPLSIEEARDAFEPEPFRQVTPNAADRARWQAWHDQYLEALKIAGSVHA